jgi:hypothetical protein
MARVTLFHRTRPEHLPLIEVEGLRTRVDLTERLGPLDAFDEAAPGRYARGRRVSGWTSRATADAQVKGLGGGLVVFTVDPARTLAEPASLRAKDVDAAWAAARPLAAWLADAGGDVAALPADLEVHVDVPVRAKLLTIIAPTFTDAELGVFAPLVTAVADRDRVAAKLLVHLHLIASEGVADTSAFRAACALAWRDAPDAPDLLRRVGRADAEAVLEGVLVEVEGVARDGVAELRKVLGSLGSDAEGEGTDVGGLLMERSEVALQRIIA